jgi:hypothetical protein
MTSTQGLTQGTGLSMLDNVGVEGDIEFRNPIDHHDPAGGGLMMTTARPARTANCLGGSPPALVGASGPGGVRLVGPHR